MGMNLRRIAVLTSGCLALCGCSTSEDPVDAPPPLAQEPATPPPIPMDSAAGFNPSAPTDPSATAGTPATPNAGMFAPPGDTGAPAPPGDTGAPAPPGDTGAPAPPGPGVNPMGDMGPMGDSAIPENGGATGDAGTAMIGDDDASPTDPAAGSEGASPAPFPEVEFSELTTSGGFTPVEKTRSGPQGAYNLYYPMELGRDGVKHPVLTWGNGALTVPDSYPLLPALASHGFVVIAASSSFVSGPLLRDGLDWLLEQNGVAGSEFEGMLDPERVGAFGYSLGSLATFEIGTDPRLTTTVHISGGIMGGGDEAQATAIDVPTAYFCDKDETGPNCDSDFAVVDDNPTFYGRVPGVGHVAYVTNAAFIDQMNTAIIAWLRWQMLGDVTMAPVFEGSDCTLCADSRWEIQKKNMP